MLNKPFVCRIKFLIFPMESILHKGLHWVCPMGPLAGRCLDAPAPLPDKRYWSMEPSGGVGIAAVQLAAAAGLTVLALPNPK
jgi:hypothetical protein